MAIPKEKWQLPVDQAALQVAASALIADATGYDFDFVGKEPGSEAPTEEEEIQDVGFPFPVTPWPNVMFLTILRMQIARPLILDICSPGSETAERHRARAKDLSWLTEGLTLSSDVLERLALDEEPAVTPIVVAARERRLIFTNCLWVLDLLESDGRIDELWTVSTKLEGHRTVHHWTLELIRRAPDVAPDFFRRLDWHQAALRGAIHLELKQLST